MLGNYEDYRFHLVKADIDLQDVYSFRRQCLLQAIQDVDDDMMVVCDGDWFNMRICLRHFYIIFYAMHPITKNNASNEIGLYFQGNRVCLYKFVLESNEQFFEAVKDIVKRINSYVAYKNKKGRRNAIRNIRTSGRT